MKLLALALPATFLMAVPMQAHAEETTKTAEAVKEKKVKKKKITDRKHPDYVRCRSESIPGSLRKRRVCLTNRQWAEAHKTGNRQARTFVEDMQVGQNASN